MNKLILIILFIAQFSAADSLIKIYNKTTGQVVKTYTNRDCKNNSLFLSISSENTRLEDLKGMKIVGLLMNKDFIEILCDVYEKDDGSLIGIYDKELFSYSIEKVNYSIKND